MAVLNIVVLGATGMIGAKVTRELAGELAGEPAGTGHRISAIVRDPEAARRKLPGTVTLIKGDVSMPATLAPVKEADVVVSMLSVNPKTARKGAFNPDLDGMRAIISAATSGRRPHVIYLGSLLQTVNPFDWWVLRDKEKAVQLLSRSGLDHTVLQPSNFMENLAERNLRGKTISLIGKPKYENWWISASDLGRLLADYLDSVPTGKTKLVVQGPEAMDYEVAARRFAAAYGPESLKVGFAPQPILALMGTFIRELNYAVNISRAINNSPEAFGAMEAWEKYGKPATTIEDFARSLGNQ